MNSIARLVSLGILLVLIIFLGMTFYKVITPYLMPLFLAAIVAVLSQPIFKYFLKKSKGNAQSSARLTTLIIIMLVMLPLVGGIAIAANQMLNMDFSANAESLEKFREKTVFLKKWMITLSEWQESFSHILDDPPEKEDEQPEPGSLEATSENNIEENNEQLNPTPEADQPETEDAETESPAIVKLSDQQIEEAADEKLAEFTESIHTGLTAMLTEIGQKSFGVAVGMFSGIASLLISLLIFVLALYYFLADGPALLEGTQKLIPMHMEYQVELLTEFEKVVRAIILATMAAAIAQGLQGLVATRALVGRQRFIGRDPRMKVARVDHRLCGLDRGVIHMAVRPSATAPPVGFARVYADSGKRWMKRASMTHYRMHPIC